MLATHKVWQFFVIMLCTSIALFLNEARMNLLLVGVMIASPIFLLQTQRLQKHVLWLIGLPLWMILSQVLIHPDTLRWSTLLFGVLYCIFFIVYGSVLSDHRVTLERYQRLLRGLIYAYAAVLLLQQLCVLFGLPIINVSNYDLAEPWKLNSLTSEPSHSAFFMAMLMTCYLISVDSYALGRSSLVISFRKYTLVWVAFLWSMTTMISASAMVMLIIVLTPFVSWRSLIQLSAVVIVAFTAAYQIGVRPVVRSVDLALATLQMDEALMAKADHSGSLRILPSIFCIKQIDFSSLEGWIGGRGIDYGKAMMYRYVPGVPEGYTGGGMFLFALEYGMIAFLIISIFSFRLCYDPRHKVISILMWALFVLLLGGMNMQLSWCCIALLYTNKQLRSRTESGTATSI